MPFKVNTKGNKNRDLTFIDLEAVGAKVNRVRVVTDTLITFTLECKGFSLYNMRICEDKKGTRFITVPSEKVGDNYYNLYAVYLSEYDRKKLIEEVLKIAEGDTEDLPFT